MPAPTPATPRSGSTRRPSDPATSRSTRTWTAPGPAVGAEGADLRDVLPIELLNSFELLAEARLDYIDAIIDYNESQFAMYVALGQPPADCAGPPGPDRGRGPDEPAPGRDRRRARSRRCRSRRRRMPRSDRHRAAAVQATAVRRDGMPSRPRASVPTIPPPVDFANRSRRGRTMNVGSPHVIGKGAFMRSPHRDASADDRRGGCAALEAHRAALLVALASGCVMQHAPRADRRRGGAQGARPGPKSAPRAAARLRLGRRAARPRSRRPPGRTVAATPRQPPAIADRRPRAVGHRRGPAGCRLAGIDARRRHRTTRTVKPAAATQ